MEVPWDLITPAGLLGVVFLMVMRGWLVPKIFVDKLDESRASWERLALAAMEQNRQLVQGSRVIQEVLQALPMTSDTSEEETT